MGQRLVITIKNEGRDIAAIYYHWSAYTYSALLETKKVIDCIYNHNDETEKELQLRLICFCEENGGGIRGSDDNSELEYIQRIFPGQTFKKDGYSRNDGLIAISPDGIKHLQYWSEGDVNISIDDDSVWFGVYSGWESIKDYIEDRKSWDDEFDEKELEDLLELDCNLGSFNVDEIDHILSEFEKVGYSASIIKCDDEIVELVM